MKKIGLIILSTGLLVGTVSFSTFAYSSNDRNAYGPNVDRFSHGKANYEQWNGPAPHTAPQKSPVQKNWGGNKPGSNYTTNGQSGRNWQSGKNGQLHGKYDQKWKNQHDQIWQAHSAQWTDYDQQWMKHRGDKKWREDHIRIWPDWYQWHHENGGFLNINIFFDSNSQPILDIDFSR